MVDYKKGLHKIGDCTYAYLQPDGSWGWSNAGFVSDGSNSILVDTLFDLKLTREMLDEISQKVKGAEKIDTLVITHANGDHVYGNELVKGAEIIASKACAEEMTETPPQMLAEMMKAAPTLGDIGRYFTHCFSEFNFDGITLTFPTNTFEGRMDLTVGSKEVNLIEVGPCHTKGDVIVHVIPKVMLSYLFHMIELFLQEICSLSAEHLLCGLVRSKTGYRRAISCLIWKRIFLFQAMGR